MWPFAGVEPSFARIMGATGGRRIGSSEGGSKLFT